MQAIRNHSSNRLFVATLLISSVLLVVLALNSLAGTYTSVAAAPELQTALVLAPNPREAQACPPNWNVVNSPNPLSNNYLKAIAVVSANDVWAAGDYSQFDNGTLGGTLFEHWNGSSWTQIPGAGGTVDHEGLLNGVASVSSNDVWAVGMYYPGTAGQNLIEHWNGTQWTIVPSPNRPGYNELLAATAISANDVWAVGDTLGTHGTLTEHWNGSNWTIVPSPPVSFGNDFLLTSVSALSSNDVWAVGYQDRGSGMSSTLIEHWDGSQWRVVPSPNPGSYYGSLYGVTAITSNDVWAVGAYSNDGGSTYPTLMLHWNGTQWNDVQGNSTSTYNSLRGVAAVSSTDIWAVGLTSDCGLCLMFDTLIEHWDGSQWSVVPSQNGNNEFNRLRGAAAASAEDVWTVGYSDQYAYPYMSDTLIEHHTCAPPLTVTGTPPTNTPVLTNTSVPASTDTPVPPTATSTSTLSATTTGTVVPATETATSTANPTACSIQFTDVPSGSTFYPFVHCLACRNIVNGYPDGTYRPNNPMTRGQLSKIVSNAAGFSEPHTEQTFEDVPVGSTFYDFVERLASRGIIAGYTCGGPGEPCVPPGSLPYFRPNANVTRGQTSKIVAIAQGLPSPPSGQQTFQDVLESSTFWPWVEALAGIGAINGYQCGGAGEPCVPSLNRPYFRPGANVTRGQSAKIVAKTFFPGCNP